MVLDPFGGELRSFETVIARAKHQKVDEVEAPQSVIDHYNPNGLGGAKYFIYKGIKVCPVGEGDAIRAAEAVQMDVKLHGGAKILGFD